MGAYLYDNALVEKLKFWTKDTKTKITGPDETRRMFELLADEKSDSPIKLPMITLQRGRTLTIDTLGKRPMTFDGVKLEAVRERTTKLDAIPITINYTLSVFTRYYKEADELVRNLIFNIINYPKIEVEIPYENTGRIHISNLRMGSDIVDNSAISERLSAGQFTIQSFSLNIDDAYLWDVRTKDNYFIDFDVEAKG